MLGVDRIENPERQGECWDFGYALNITRELKAFSGAFVQILGAECKRESSGNIQMISLQAFLSSPSPPSPPSLGCNTPWVLNWPGWSSFHCSAPAGWRCAKVEKPRAKMFCSRSYNNIPPRVLPVSLTELPLRNTWGKGVYKNTHISLTSPLDSHFSQKRSICTLLAVKCQGNIQRTTSFRVVCRP